MFSPMLFNVYMCPLIQLVQSSGLGCYQYTEDTQLSLLMDGRPDIAPSNLAVGLEAIARWLKQS